METSRPSDTELWPCPACGFLVFDQPAAWQICPVCNWEDDEVQLRHPTMAGGLIDRQSRGVYPFRVRAGNQIDFTS